MTILDSPRSAERARRAAATPEAAGFGLVEILISLGLLAIIVMGILPLFARATTHNVEGGQLLKVTNQARHHLERLMILPFDDPDLTVPVGSTELRTIELYSSDQDRWFAEDEFPADENATYARVTRVRQFSVSATEDSELELEDDEALVGGSSAAIVHLKEIEVRVNSGRRTDRNAMGVRKAITIRILRSS